MLLLDTNTVIYYFKGMGNVAERLLATPPSQIAIASITLYELEVGIAKSTQPQKRQRQLNQFVEAITLLPFAAEQARVTARLRANLEQAGTPIGPMDTLIAGTALTHHATIVTRNTREFSRVPMLVCEDWY